MYCRGNPDICKSLNKVCDDAINACRSCDLLCRNPADCCSFCPDIASQEPYNLSCPTESRKQTTTTTTQRPNRHRTRKHRRNGRRHRNRRQKRSLDHGEENSYATAVAQQQLTNDPHNGFVALDLTSARSPNSTLDGRSQIKLDTAGVTLMANPWLLLLLGLGLILISLVILILYMWQRSRKQNEKSMDKLECGKYHDQKGMMGIDVMQTEAFAKPATMMITDDHPTSAENQTLQCAADILPKD